MEVRLVNHMGTFEDVAHVARVSTDTKPDPERDHKLVRYLYRHRHTSPFEFVVTRWLVTVPIFVARQWMRHRTWSYSERSARYTEFEDEVFEPEVWRGQAVKNRQASDGVVAQPEMVEGLYKRAVDDALDTYWELIGQGVSRELARGVLPTASYTKFMAQVDMHNLLHFLRLRDDEHAQPEIQLCAKMIKQELRREPDLQGFVSLLEGDRG